MFGPSICWSTNVTMKHKEKDFTIKKISFILTIILFDYRIAVAFFFSIVSFSPHTPCAKHMGYDRVHSCTAHFISCKVKKGPALAGLVLLPKSRQPSN